MSDLVVLGFKGEDTADQVLNKLFALRKEHLVDLEDAAVVVRDQKGSVRIKQMINLITTGAVTGGTWGSLFGTLVGLLVLNPLAGLVTGAVAGAAAGALSGALSDYGIDDDFIKVLGSTLEPGSSALLVLVRRATLDKVLPELRPFNPKVLRTSLSLEQEAALKKALEDYASRPQQSSMQGTTAAPQPA